MPRISQPLPSAKALVVRLLVLLLAIPLSAIWAGFTFSVLWAWFVVPTFSAPPLTIPVAIGLVLLVAFLTYQHSRSSTTGDTSTAEMIARAILRPALVLLLGYVVHLFV